MDTKMAASATLQPSRSIPRGITSAFDPLRVPHRSAPRHRPAKPVSGFREQASCLSGANSVPVNEPAPVLTVVGLLDGMRYPVSFANLSRQVDSSTGVGGE